MMIQNRFICNVVWFLLFVTLSLFFLIQMSFSSVRVCAPNCSNLVSHSDVIPVFTRVTQPSSVLEFVFSTRVLYSHLYICVYLRYSTQFHTGICLSTRVCICVCISLFTRVTQPSFVLEFVFLPAFCTPLTT